MDKAVGSNEPPLGGGSKKVGVTLGRGSLLVATSPKDRTRLIAKEKASWLIRLINAQRLKEIHDTKENNNNIVNKVYTLCLDFLDS